MKIMAKIFWTGKLSPLMKLMVNCNCVLAWIKGNTNDDSSMKQRVKLGYNGKFTNHIMGYEKKGLEHYTRFAKALLKKINIENQKVLDVGCGSGILSFLLLEKSAKKVVAGDFSNRMLRWAKAKYIKQGYGNSNRIQFLCFDAESLPFNNENFDIVVSGLVMGIVPNQEKMIAEMVRVARGGVYCSINTWSQTLLRGL